MQIQANKPVRHVPTKTTGIYYSVRAIGKKVFECRYTDSSGKRPYTSDETGPGLSKRSRDSEPSSKGSRSGLRERGQSKPYAARRGLRRD